MPNGNVVANVSLATSETWKDKSTGEQQEKTGVAPSGQTSCGNRRAVRQEGHQALRRRASPNTILGAGWRKTVQHGSCGKRDANARFPRRRARISAAPRWLRHRQLSPVSSRPQRRLRISTILTTTFHSSDHPSNGDRVSAAARSGRRPSGRCAKRDLMNLRRPASGIKRSMFRNLT